MNDNLSKETAFPQQLYFLRHGQTDWNHQGICMGSTDIPLNDIGRSQAHKAGTILQNINIKTIVYSPLIRAAETAKIISTYLPQSNNYSFDEFSERHWGQWQGKLNSYITNNLNNTPNDIETAEALIQRIKKGIEKIYPLPTPLIIVSHGGVFKSLCHLLGTTPSTPENAHPLKYDPINNMFKSETGNFNRATKPFTSKT